MSETLPWHALKSYVNASATEDAFVESCWNRARELIGMYVGGPAVTTEQQAIRAAALALVPPDILDGVTVEVGSELYHHKNAPSGISQFAAPDGQGIRISRDPMVAARPQLQIYMEAGFA